MNELITVTYESDRPVVSARELHRALEVKTAYKDWFPRMCEYGFNEGQDFCSILSESTGGRPAQDALLTIDAAKEIAMLQRTDKGKQVRQYFIQLEKDWNSPEKVMARALQIANKRIEELKARNFALLAENEQQRQTIADFEPVKQYVDVILESTGTIATTQIAADYGLSAKALNRILHEAGVQHKVNGQWILYREHMGKGYTDSRTFPFTRRNGVKDSAVHTYWTQKGRLMIHDILKARDILPLMDRKEV